MSPNCVSHFLPNTGSLTVDRLWRNLPPKIQLHILKMLGLQELNIVASSVDYGSTAEAEIRARMNMLSSAYGVEIGEVLALIEEAEALVPLTGAPWRALTRKVEHDHLIPDCQFLYVSAMVNLLDLPEELMEDILFASLYHRSEFRLSVDYSEFVKFGSPFSDNQDWFVQCAMLVNKRFQRLRKEVLWRMVVIRSVLFLRSIIEQAGRKERLWGDCTLGEATWRLQVRIGGEYIPSEIAQVIAQMPNLQIFMFDNQPIPEQEPFTVSDLSEITMALRNAPNVKRIQFDSPRQHPTIHQVRNILHYNPQLVCLRMESIAPLHPIPQGMTTMGLYVRPRMLKELSIGSTGQDYSGRGVVQALNSLLHLLAVAPLQSLSRLTSVHLLQYILTTTVGPRNFLDTCPNVQTLIWVIAHWESLNQHHRLPQGHQKLNVIMIVYPQEEVPVSQAHVQDVLQSLDSNGFPALKHIQLKSSVGASRQLQLLTWFRAWRRSVAKRGIVVTLLLETK
ncbi:hypothetical protein NMY22_g14624 [Coprinellus aureogranulatus]|nr:hypothetical protein NMY22_g14624 [Coprinellus aureogranulatus]